MNPKIQRLHLSKAAYIYIRQSTMGQVRHHRESTERQYALRDRALELGWPAEAIRILDGDLGLSGTRAQGREDFQALVADVSMKKAGAVFALEASRLARSCLDWHRLVELCAFTGTLMIDEDGCYDPADFNDQLLLGLKGTLSQAELHFLRGRLQGGKLNKARKGELRTPLPVGLVYDDEGKIVLDPDAEVRQAVQRLFESFRGTASACAVVRQFAREGLTFPRRAYGGIWNGRLLWGPLTDGRVLAALKNPAYAGTYVFGRNQTTKDVLPDGTVRSKSTAMPMASWTVRIPGHHEAYIRWDEFLENQMILQRNRTNGEEMLLSGPAREGLALCQGLLLCGTCGRRLTVRYKGNGGLYPTYECNWRRREGLAGRPCMIIRCDLVDRSVVARALAVIEPRQIELAIQAFEELERRAEAVSNQWRMRIERAEYEAQLAQRRYEQVDPSNRLVAATLERRWNDALGKVEETKKEFAARQNQERPALSTDQKAKLQALAADLPRLWNAPTTQARDRKRILRLLIKDITVEKLAEPKQFILHLRWQGGACEDISIAAPPPMAEQVRYPPLVVEKVRELAETLPDSRIAESLNQQSLVSPTGKAFTASMVKWIRYRHSIPAPSLKRPEELTVMQVAQRFGVSPSVVYYWIERKRVCARRVNRGMPYWITIDPRKEKELVQWVGSSQKIQKRSRLSSRNPAAGGAV